MEHILECNDMFGRKVVLTRPRWAEHILLDHAEMEPLLHLIQEALERPNLVNYDAVFPGRENYYLLSAAGTRSNRHVKVCVEYERDADSGVVAGTVITAFVTRSVKNSEVTAWRRSS